MRMILTKYKYKGIYQGDLIITTNEYNININLNTHQILQFKRRSHDD